VRGIADVNAPLSDGSALRIAVMGQGGAVSTRLKATANDYGVAPSVRFGMDGTTQVTLAVLVQHNTDRFDYGVPPLNGQPVRSGWKTVYGNSDDHTIQDVAAFSAEVRHGFASGLTLRDQI
jgi:catecholate siderophore receptor